ncbi:MAG: hypothetical protein ACPGLV_09195 [Bacteroidia bacterium]
MAKKATKRELKRKTRAGARKVLLSKSTKKSYLRPDAYKVAEESSASNDNE